MTAEYTQAERLEIVEGFVKALTPMVTNETHAWNVWNYIASDRGAMRRALEWAWAQYPLAEGADQ